MRTMTSKAITLAAILALTGCAQMKGSSKVYEKANRVDIKGPNAMGSPYGECTRGLFKALLYKDFVNEDGSPFVTAKGVMTKEPLQGVNANYLLGDEQLIRGKSAPDIKKIKFEELGNVVEINLGLNPRSAARSETGDPPDAKELRAQLSLIAEGSRDSSPLLAIDLIKKNNIFMGQAKLDQHLIEAAADDADVEASAAGVGPIRSMLLKNNGLIKIMGNGAAVADLPADVGGNDILEGTPTVGAPLVISVVPATPTVSSTWFTVVVSDASDAPKSAFRYRVVDSGQDKLEIPTTSMTELKSAWIRVNRSHMTATEIQGGGKFCVEAAAGVLLPGKVEAPKK